MLIYAISNKRNKEVPQANNNDAQTIEMDVKYKEHKIYLWVSYIIMSECSKNLCLIGKRI